MDYFPAALENLVEQFAKLPGVGRKSAQRLAFFILDQPEQAAKDFAAALLDAQYVFCTDTVSSIWAE